MDYRVELRRLDPALAELHFAFPDLPADVEVRGRLMGPRCPGVNTVEVAYHLRPAKDGGYQVLIPEPSQWTPERPYVYEGPIEFYRAGAKVDARRVSVGLRAGGELLENET